MPTLVTRQNGACAVSMMMERRSTFSARHPSSGARKIILLNAEAHHGESGLTGPLVLLQPPPVPLLLTIGIVVDQESEA